MNNGSLGNGLYVAHLNARSMMNPNSHDMIVTPTDRK